MKIIAWAMWYVDVMHSSKTMDFEDLPRDGALCFVTYEDRLKPNGDQVRNMYQGYDYYFRADGKLDYLYACDLDSRERMTMKDINERYTNPIIIRGQWTDRMNLQNVLDLARSWQPWTYSKPIPISRYK